jgi:hypothetical protein
MDKSLLEAVLYRLILLIQGQLPVFPGKSRIWGIPDAIKSDCHRYRIL